MGLNLLGRLHLTQRVGLPVGVAAPNDPWHRYGSVLLDADRSVVHGYPVGPVDMVICCHGDMLAW